MIKTAPYSEFAFAIDLIREEYQISNPILIAEKINEDLDMDISIFQIMDYLEMSMEDFEQESRKQYYSQVY